MKNDIKTHKKKHSKIPFYEQVHISLVVSHAIKSTIVSNQNLAKLFGLYKIPKDIYTSILTTIKRENTSIYII